MCHKQVPCAPLPVCTVVLNCCKSQSGTWMDIIHCRFKWLRPQAHIIFETMSLGLMFTIFQCKGWGRIHSNQYNPIWRAAMNCWYLPYDQVITWFNPTIKDCILMVALVRWSMWLVVTSYRWTQHALSLHISAFRMLVNVKLDCPTIGSSHVSAITKQQWFNGLDHLRIRDYLVSGSWLLTWRTSNEIVIWRRGMGNLKSKSGSRNWRRSITVGVSTGLFQHQYGWDQSMEEWHKVSCYK